MSTRIRTFTNMRQLRRSRCSQCTDASIQLSIQSVYHRMPSWRKAWPWTRSVIYDFMLVLLIRDIGFLDLFSVLEQVFCAHTHGCLSVHVWYAVLGIYFMIPFRLSSLNPSSDRHLQDLTFVSILLIHHFPPPIRSAVISYPHTIVLLVNEPLEFELVYQNRRKKRDGVRTLKRRNLHRFRHCSSIPLSHRFHSFNTASVRV